MGVSEFMGCGLVERWSGQIRRRIDLKLYVFVARCSAFVQGSKRTDDILVSGHRRRRQSIRLRLQVLGAVLAITSELTQSLFVDRVDLLPDGTRYELWERTARHLWFTATHSYD